MTVKNLVKAIGRSEGFTAFVCLLGSWYIRLCRATGRWETVNGDAAEALWAENKPFILAFWHGRLLMMPYVWRRDRRIHMLISAHRDGRFISDTVAHFDIKTVAGSSTRGGAAALRTMLKTLKAGEWVGITPDGPRGPRMRASMGVVAVAKASGAPVLCASFGAKRRKVLGSWDRFLVPRPFSGGVFVWGDPIAVPRDADEAAMEEWRRRVEDSLNATAETADRMTGHDPIEPAPAAQGDAP